MPAGSVLLYSLAAALLLLGVGALVIAAAGWQGRLDRHGRWGVRTPAASSSDTAFAVANRVAAPVAAAAGLIGVVTAALVVGVRLPTLPTLVVFAVGLLGLVAVYIAGAVIGERAARAVPVPARAPANAGGAGCGGCGCGGGGCAGLTRTTAAVVTDPA